MSNSKNIQLIDILNNIIIELLQNNILFIKTAHYASSLCYFDLAIFLLETSRKTHESIITLKKEYNNSANQIINLSLELSILLREESLQIIPNTIINDVPLIFDSIFSSKFKNFMDIMNQAILKTQNISIMLFQYYNLIDHKILAKEVIQFDLNQFFDTCSVHIYNIGKNLTKYQNNILEQLSQKFQTEYDLQHNDMRMQKHMPMHMSNHISNHISNQMPRHMLRHMPTSRSRINYYSNINELLSNIAIEALHNTKLISQAQHIATSLDVENITSLLDETLVHTSKITDMLHSLIEKNSQDDAEMLSAMVISWKDENNKKEIDIDFKYQTLFETMGEIRMHACNEFINFMQICNLKIYEYDSALLDILRIYMNKAFSLYEDMDIYQYDIYLKFLKYYTDKYSREFKQLTTNTN